VITPINSSINKEHVARALRDCDIVFGCTDKETPRAILTQLALRYTIPVFDLGVLINSVEGKISDIYGRVTTLMPGNSCLFCRGRISAEAIRLENLSTKDRQMQVRDGYAPELDDEPAPAVIAFTSATASLAVSELLHRLTGFMGPDRDSSEVLAAFDQSRIRTNRVMPNEQCTCADMATWGRGDTSPFLEMVWA
jgi:molybdopterin/thiamine biosynthesis adenylyltransferase